MAKDGDRVVGIKEIAHKLGYSDRQVRRFHADKKLKTFQPGGAGSAIKMRKVDLDKMLRGR